MESVAIDDKDALSQYIFGRLLSLQGDFDEAEQRLNRAIQLNPNDTDAHNNLGVLLVAQQQIDEAIEHYHTALKLDPDSIDVQQNLRIAIEKRGGANRSSNIPPTIDLP